MAKSRAEVVQGRRQQNANDKKRNETANAPGVVSSHNEVLAEHHIRQQDLTWPAVEIVKHEHLKDTPVFTAASDFLAAKFKDATPTPPSPPIVPQTESQSADPAPTEPRGE